MLLLILLISLLQACTTLGTDKKSDLPNATFNNPNPRAKLSLVLIGGNSECDGDKGIWLIRDKILSDFSQAIGIKDKFSDISTLYFSWTGDPGGHPGCLPGKLDYLNGGKERIIDTIKAQHMLDHEAPPLVLVGWSNGGATATQLASEIATKNDAKLRPIDLLITLDPVSGLTDRPKNSGALQWMNVYTHSEWFNRFMMTNIIAFVGGAWNKIDNSKTNEPAFQACMQGNHGDTREMWNIIATSRQFSDWASPIRTRIGGESSKAQKNTKPEQYP